MKAGFRKDSLCWDCANAVPDKEGRGCNWSRKLEPVPGWKTIETSVLLRKHENGEQISIREPWIKVIGCPEFIKG